MFPKLGATVSGLPGSSGHHEETRCLEDCDMKPDNPAHTRTRPAAINKHATDARTPRAIRFSESEWQQVRIAAAKRGISFSSFVREAAMIHAAGQSEDATAPLSPAIEELIKQTFRYAFFLASIKRDEILQDGRGPDVDQAVKRARAAEAELLSTTQHAPPHP